MVSRSCRTNGNNGAASSGKKHGGHGGDSKSSSKDITLNANKLKLLNQRHHRGSRNNNQHSNQNNIFSFGSILTFSGSNENNNNTYYTDKNNSNLCILLVLFGIMISFVYNSFPLDSFGTVMGYFGNTFFVGNPNEISHGKVSFQASASNEGLLFHSDDISRDKQSSSSLHSKAHFEANSHQQNSDNTVSFNRQMFAEARHLDDKGVNDGIHSQPKIYDEKIFEKVSSMLNNQNLGSLMNGEIEAAGREVITKINTDRNGNGIHIGLGSGVGTPWMGTINSHSYNYYYYDTYTQSFRLYDEYSYQSSSYSDPYASRPTTMDPDSLNHRQDKFDRAHDSHTHSDMPEFKYNPQLCNDGYTIGFNDWNTLRNSIHERSARYEEAYNIIEDYHAAIKEYKLIKLLHYSHDMITKGNVGRTGSKSILHHDNRNNIDDNILENTKSNSNEKDTFSTLHNNGDNWEIHINDNPQNLQRSKQSFSSFTTHHNQEDIVTIQPPPTPPLHLTSILEEIPEPITICPYAHLKSSQHLLNQLSELFLSTLPHFRATSSHASYSHHHNHFSSHHYHRKRQFYNPQNPTTHIRINADSLNLQCTGCIIEATNGGTHLSFGPLARNVLIHGLTFIGATESSVLFPENGARVEFEDCYWANNDGLGNNGAVADINSTSTVRFYRCEISDKKTNQSPRVTQSSMQGGLTSSLTIRAN